MSPNTIQPQVEYKNLFQSNTIESSALSNAPIVPELKETYDRMLIYLEKLFRDRFKKIREVVHKLHSGLNSEETISAYLLSNDETMKNIGIKKYKEIVENTLAAEREAYIERLAHEVTILNEKVVIWDKEYSKEKAKAWDDLENQNKKLRLQVMSLKKSNDELTSVNEDTLNELEIKEKQIKELNNLLHSKGIEKPNKNIDNIQTLKRENSILATQLREMQEELAENSSISKIHNKNTSWLEITNNMLSERWNVLERENREFEEKLMTLSESQAQLNLHGITRLKNKVTKLKDTLNLRSTQWVELESEIIKLNQMLENKEKEMQTLFNQYQELRVTYESESQNKDLLYLEKLKSKDLLIKYRHER